MVDITSLGSLLLSKANHTCVHLQPPGPKSQLSHSQCDHPW